MKPNLIAVAFTAAALSLTGAVLAQSNADRGGGFTHGESKRCESMTGSAKEQCDKQEATKTDGEAQSPPATAFPTRPSKRGNIPTVLVASFRRAARRRR